MALHTTYDARLDGRFMRKPSLTSVPVSSTISYVMSEMAMVSVSSLLIMMTLGSGPSRDQCWPVKMGLASCEAAVSPAPNPSLRLYYRHPGAPEVCAGSVTWRRAVSVPRTLSLSLYNFPLYNFPLHNSERGLASSPAAVSSEPSAAGLHAVPLHSPRGGEKKSAMDTEMVAVKAGRRALCRPPRAPHAYSPRQSGAARPCSTPPGGARQGPIVGYVLQSAAPTGPSP